MSNAFSMFSGFLNESSQVVTKKTIYICKCGAGESLQTVMVVAKRLISSGTMILSLKKNNSFAAPAKTIFSATLNMSKGEILYRP